MRVYAAECARACAYDVCRQPGSIQGCGGCCGCLGGCVVQYENTEAVAQGWHEADDGDTIVRGTG